MNVIALILSRTVLKLPIIGVGLVGLSLLAACSGTNSDGMADNNAGVEADRKLLGAAMKGPIQHAGVDLFAVDGQGQLGVLVTSGSTDGNGQFDVDVPPDSNALLVQTVGGFYLDEADTRTPPRQISFGEAEGLLGYVPAGSDTVVVSIVTNLLVNKARDEAAGGNFSAVIANNRENAVQAFGFDVLTTIPADPLNPDPAASPAARAYAQALGGLANAVAVAATKLGLAEPNVDVVQAVVLDFSDGRLDGLYQNEPVLVSIGEEAVELPTDVNLNQQIKRFYNNNPVYANDPLLVVDEPLLAQSGAEPNNPPVALDDAYTLIQDETLSVSAAAGVLLNDTDPEPYPLFVELVSDVENGELSLQSDGGFTYQHDGSNTQSDSFTYQVTDISEVSNLATVNFTIESNNNPPTIEPQSFVVDENAANGTIIGTVEASDPDEEVNGDRLTYVIQDGNDDNTFVIDTNTGELTVNNNAALDFEATQSFNFNVLVTDEAGASAVAEITVNVQNVNEPPELQGATFSVPENSPAGSLVGNLVAADPDADDALQYVITAGNLPVVFAVDNAGVLSVSDPAILDFETSQSFTLSITVTDTGGLSDTASVIVNVDDVNEPPVFEGRTFDIDENSVDGTVVGTLQANDPDADDNVSFAITSGNTSDAFALDANSGVLTVADTNQFDFETSPTFTLEASATDNAGLSQSADITVNLQNVDEPPIIVTNNGIIVEPESSMVLTIQDLQAGDPDTAASELVFILVGAPQTGVFMLDNSVTSQFTLQQLIDGEVSFAHDGELLPLNEGFEMEVSDATSSLAFEFEVTVATELFLRESVLQDGSELTGGSSENAALSPGANFSAFVTGATNAPTVSAVAQAYRRQRFDEDFGDGEGTPFGDLVLLSVDNNGNVANSAASNPKLANNGQQALFLSAATNFQTGNNTNNANGVMQIWLRDFNFFSFEAVAVEAIGEGGFGQLNDGLPSALNIQNFAGYIDPDGDSMQAVLSDSGTNVAFASDASNLVQAGKAGNRQVYNAEIISGSITTINITQLSASTLDGQPGNAASEWPSISENGEWVVFQSLASNLVENDTNASVDIFLANTFEQTLVAITDVQVVGDSLRPSISADGSRIALLSSNNSLVSDDTTGLDVFVYDVDNASFHRVSTDANGQVSVAADFGAPCITGNGSYVAYVSTANDLAGSAASTGEHSDLFIKRLPDSLDSSNIASNIVRYAVGNTGLSTDAASTAPSCSAEGGVIAIDSEASVLVEGDNNGESDTFTVFNPLP